MGAEEELGVPQVPKTALRLGGAELRDPRNVGPDSLDFGSRHVFWHSDIRSLSGYYH